MVEGNNEQDVNRIERVKGWTADYPFFASLITVGVILLVLLLISMVILPDAFPGWLGLGEVTDDAGKVVRARKTVWDWLELLIVPAMLAGAAAWIALSQQKRELEERENDRQIANEARETDREIAREDRETDTEIARDRQEQATLESYYDRMADLLLTHELRSKSDESDEERSIARARTLTVLRSLNSARKGQVIRFLYESNLINSYSPVVVLAKADLSGIDLGEANLSKSDLRDTDLREADLTLADLCEACLVLVNLSKATLTFADLSKADLAMANLKDADLVYAGFSDADLIGANLSDANLFSASLDGADMVSAKLINTYLTEADLSGADLSRANLSGAHLGGTYLQFAKYTADTQWPEDFDPKAAGAILIDEEDNHIEHIEE